VAGLLVFAAGSLACAVADSPGLLIAARLVQGLGPPLILPASLAIVAASYPDPHERARAIGFWGAGSGIGVASGPIIGGLVVQALGWRWAFAFNVPLSLLLAGAAMVAVPANRGHKGEHRFDRAGALLVTLGMAGLVFGIIEGRERGWTSVAVLGAFAAGAGLMAAFAVVERRHPDPLIDLELLRRPAFAAANLGGGTMIFVLIGATVYLSALLQETRGMTPLGTGVALLPLGVAVALLAPVSGRLTARIPARTMIVAGMLCACAGTAMLSRVHDGPFWPGLIVLGIGTGLALPTMTAAAVSAVPARRTGMASAIHNASRQVGATLGVAVLGTVVLSHDSLGAGLRAALTVSAVVLLVVAALAARLLSD
jgi:DHA2 family methylenomycin A resistance protein-like MFS transporter